MSFEWTKIAGYREDMTADEKLALLDSEEEKNQPPAEPEADKQAPAQPEPEQQPPVKPSPRLISKVQFDKVASELAKVNKELRARMTAEEQKEVDRMLSCSFGLFDRLFSQSSSVEKSLFSSKSFSILIFVSSFQNLMGSKLKNKAAFLKN